MKEYDINDPVSDLKHIEKKEWQAPQMKQLNLKESKGGDFPLPYENAWEVFAS